MRLPKEFKPILKAAREQGWKIREGKSGPIIYPPDGSRPIPLHATPGRMKRSHANILAACRRHGLDL